MNNAFFSFCVGWLSIIFGTLHNNGRPNERALTDPPPCPLRLVARQIAPSLACLSLPSTAIGIGIGLLYIVGNERIARGGGTGCAASGPDTVTMTM